MSNEHNRDGESDLAGEVEAIAKSLDDWGILGSREVPLLNRAAARLRTLEARLDDSDANVERLARAVCWAFAVDTDDCSSQCFIARKCAAAKVNDCFKRDARAILTAIKGTSDEQ